VTTKSGGTEKPPTEKPRPSNRAILAYLKRKRDRIRSRNYGRLQTELPHGEYITFNVSADEADLELVLSVGGVTLFVKMDLPEAKQIRRKLGMAIKDRTEELRYMR
jgi:hypothetical protein